MHLDRFLGGFFISLTKISLLLMKDVLKSLAKSVLIPPGLIATADAGILNKSISYGK